MTTEPVFEQIAEAIDHEFSASIEDGVFKITPAEAGIAMFAALTTANDAEARAWEAADALAKQHDKLRTENAKYRAVLESLVVLLDELGFEDRSNEIERALWPVVGVLDDGTEVEFEYHDEPAECEYCANGRSCDCAGAQ
jgi:hypothetical protein